MSLRVSCKSIGKSQSRFCGFADIWRTAHRSRSDNISLIICRPDETTAVTLPCRIRAPRRIQCCTSHGRHRNWLPQAADVATTCVSYEPCFLVNKKSVYLHMRDNRFNVSVSGRMRYVILPHPRSQIHGSSRHFLQQLVYVGFIFYAYSANTQKNIKLLLVYYKTFAASLIILLSKLSR